MRMQMQMKNKNTQETNIKYSLLPLTGYLPWIYIANGDNSNKKNTKKHTISDEDNF